MKDAAARLASELGLALDAGEIERVQRLATLEPGASLEALAEQVLVHETWFHRDPQMFEHLAALAPRLTQPVRVLCAPCSTGEEAWSLALTLVRAGVPPERFDIVAADVSASVLAIAFEGRYGPRSFRGAHAPGEAHTWRAPSELRKCIDWRQVNLLDPAALAGEAPFDVVACRNLLIYLLPRARARLIELLARLVAPGGVLYLGQAETVEHPAFVRDGRPEHLAWRRVVTAPASTPRPRAPARTTGPVAAAHPVRLEDARRYADRGDLELALSTCRALLAEGAVLDPDVYTLLGTVLHARGDAAGALDAWRRAVYLAPDHPTALVHLGLALKAAGDVARGEAMLERAAAKRDDEAAPAAASRAERRS